LLKRFDLGGNKDPGDSLNNLSTRMAEGTEQAHAKASVAPQGPKTFQPPRAEGGRPRPEAPGYYDEQNMGGFEADPYSQKPNMGGYGNYYGGGAHPADKGYGGMHHMDGYDNRGGHMGMLLRKSSDGMHEMGNDFGMKPASKPPIIREGDWLCPDPTVG
jgi:hypothetical protein